MIPYPDFPHNLPGVTLALEAAGIQHVCEGGVWKVSDLAAAQAVVAAHDPLTAARAEKMAEAAEARWQAVTGGHTTAAGIPLLTDATSIMMIGALFATASAGIPGPFSFKDRAGSFRSLSAADVQAMYADVSVFVQACFNRERDIGSAIAAATTWQEVVAIDARGGFPPNT